MEGRAKRPFSTMKDTQSNGPPKRRSQQKPLILSTGQLALRLLSKTSSISGIIGKSGAVIKLIQQETNSTIRIEDPIVPSDERVVLVVGFITPRKNMKLMKDESGFEEHGVSPIQEALIRVYERALEVEAESGGVFPAPSVGGVVGCRLLAETNQIGVVMGKGGKRIEKIRKDSGAKIRIVQPEQRPTCAGPNDEVIQINGDALAVKKAVLAISQILQDFPPSDKLQTFGSRPVPHETYLDPRTEPLPYRSSFQLPEKVQTFVSRPVPHEIYPDPRTEPLPYRSSFQIPEKVQTFGSRPVPHEIYPDPRTEPLPYRNSFIPLSKPPHPGISVDYISRGPTVSSEIDRIPTVDSNTVQQEVAFRLLCSDDRIGGVIGKRGAIIRALQSETGASISIGAAAAESDERVITVSSSENLESRYSTAQNAVLRVFQRSLEVGIEKGLDSGSKKGTTVSARLLISPNQVGCIMGKGGSVISEIRTVTGVSIQVISGDKVPKCASENDQVVQIVGESANVQDALLHVTSKLRDNLSPKKKQSKIGVRSYLPSTYPEINPYERQAEPSSPGLYPQIGLSCNIDRRAGLTQSMNHLGLAHNFDRPLSPRPWTSQTMNGTNLRGTSDIGRGATTLRGGLDLGSGSKSAIVTNTTVDIVVPEDAIRSVYGESGNNLTRIRQISGAKVTVHEPRLGSTDRTIIISGTPDQTQAAQSLLHAFILSG
ncbi:hypothetical protein GIB67_019574 [Kingdonia uniflora]|uniref:K Homology domain-containing protein n=1 Tax=Kingdonia uniflora TaxID=39325 RepID=A0A7J7N0Q9_9MAGN|nr:hypothetical protein GIB67_019574 [Kingdonia uniflora]